jgi:hypothetical protein
MKPRTAFIGCLAGLIASRLLFPVFTDYLPGTVGLAFTQQSPTQNVILLMCILSALVTLAGGYIAARLEWAKTWQRAVSCGVNSGILAGCLAYMLSGASAAAGVLGQKEILLSLDRPIASESAGIGLLVLGVVNAAVWTQVIFWLIMIPSLALGAFGGLLSLIEKSPGWISEPASKKPDLERVVVYSFGSFGIFNLVIFIAVMALMPGITQRAILENQVPTSGLLATPSFIMILPLVTAAASLIPCLILAIKWALEAWDQPGERFRVKVWLGTLGLFALLLLLVKLYLALAVIGVFAVIALAIWVLRRKRTPTPPATEFFKPYTPLDYLASALAQGILCGTLPAVLSIAYALSLVLIAIVDIPHLTLTGVVNSSAREQVLSLYTTMGAYSVILLLAASVIGLVIVALGGATGILRSQPAKPVVVTEVSNLGDE